LFLQVRRQRQQRAFRKYIVHRVLKRSVLTMRVVFTLQKAAYIRQLAKLKVKEMGLNVYDEIKARQSLSPLESTM